MNISRKYIKNYIRISYNITNITLQENTYRLFFFYTKLFFYRL